MAAPALPRIGAHVSVGGGLERVWGRLRNIGAEAAQVFPSNPRQWRRPTYPPEVLRDFKEVLGRAGVPLFAHTIYLINLASPDARLRRRSSSALADALVFGVHAGSAGIVTHVGSHRGEGFERARGRVLDALEEARALACSELGADAGVLPPILLESGAGSSGTVGSPDELACLLEEAGSGVGFCLDTAHLFAAGLPVHTAEGLDELLSDLDQRIGLRRLGLVHLNDSKAEFGSRRDRHENLWEGFLGREGLGRWVRRPELREVPFVLETPGFGQEGPDRKNVRRAKILRGTEAAARSSHPRRTAV